MSFHAPLLLLLAPVAAGAAWALARYAAQRRREALALFGGERAAAATGALARQRTLRAALVAGALALGLVALAGPTFGTVTRETTRESLDLVVALDVSRSMLTADTPPNRLARARLDVQRLLEDRAADRVALVFFAGEAFIQCPLTSDHAAVRLFLDTASPDAIAVQGTRFAAALDAADTAFGTDDARPRALVVVSDGEDHEGGLDEAAARLRARGIATFALGVGTDDGGLVPGNGTRLTPDGEPVVSRYTPAALRQIAGADDVIRAGRAGVAELTRRLDGLDRATVDGGRRATGAERYQWPLALALLLLAFERRLATASPPPGEVSPVQPATEGVHRS